MCHSNFIVFLPHISPWTQSLIQAFIVAYEKLTFKSVKQNCCFRNQPWDAVKSRQALKKGCIKSTNQNAIFFARIYQILNSNLNIANGTKINLFLIGIFTNQQTCHTNELDQHQSKMYCSHGTQQSKNTAQTCCFCLLYTSPSPRDQA